ncbi:hypothetical protein [Lachnoclostridium sp. MSJ-17]|uniref:hypothetical protein n=1 Tax=Lachnoclostridium sp. MSJ-17 TaxID=2841516 RepID=UPI001C113B58|nr:hypothetical protein [Lachnoclostridium sp. MSJ-17]MBU5462021.1 hypothetical protein [Lachnoclostridium sp. MSJ-17]
MLKKSLSIIIVLCMILGCFSVTGTAFAAEADYQLTGDDGYTEISTVEDLYTINTNLSGSYRLMNDIDLSEATAEGGEWDYSGNGWEPIGSNGIYGKTAFNGTFDGNGYEIKGLRINMKSKPSGTGDIYLGLFASNSGTIKNLTVSGSVSAGSNIYVYYAGAIAGYNYGAIEGCCNKAEITIPYGTYASGIAGYTYSGGKVTQCYNTGSISATRKSSNGVYASGITHCANGTVSDCYNTGNITASNTYNAAYASSAGISACSGSGSINNCYNTGTAAKAISYTSVTNCYFLSGSGADITGAKLLNDSQMKKLELFKGFDTANTWFIDENAEYKYPQLRNNKQTKDSEPGEGYAPTMNDGVYEIRTVRDLSYVNTNLSGSYRLMNDINLSEATAEGGEWDYLGNGWEPIGSNGIYGKTAFNGTFDGNGYEIKGLRINMKSKPSGTGDIYLGLFASNSGTIKNLTVSGSVSAGSNIYVYYAGAIAGYNYGAIEGCCNKAEITIPYGTYASGIAGYTYSGGKVTQCYNTGNISVECSRDSYVNFSGITYIYGLPACAIWTARISAERP